jgi:hypothetical protein
MTSFDQKRKEKNFSWFCFQFFFSSKPWIPIRFPLKRWIRIRAALEFGKKNIARFELKTLEDLRRIYFFYCVSDRVC